MDPRDAFVHGNGSLNNEGSLGAEAQRWLQALPGTAYITDSTWWLGELHFLSDSVAIFGKRSASDYRSQPELWLTQIAEPERRRLLEQLQQALTGGKSSVRLSYVMAGRDEAPCMIEDDINILRGADGEVSALVGVMRLKSVDVTVGGPARHRSPARDVRAGRDSPDQNSSNATLLDHSLLNQGSDLIMALDEDLDCLEIAGNIRDALGIAGEALQATSLFGLMAPEDGSRIRRLLMESAAESASTMAELRLRHRDGEYRWFEIQFSPCLLPGGEDSVSRSMSVPGWVAVARDVTQRRQQSLQWNTYTATDELTSALDREPFMGLLRHAFSSGDAGTRYTLIVFDVDHFSDINHAWGREGGDLVLSCIGEMCRATLRERFSFGRLGGDSFALLMSAKSLQETATIAERLRGRFAATRVEFHGHWLAFSVSLGVAERRSGEPAEALLGRAQAGVKAAKENGRDRVQQAP